MIQDDIINELRHIPEAKLAELYDLIHYFRLGLDSEAGHRDLAIDKNQCLNALEKIKQGGYSDFSEIVDVEKHIANL